MKRRQWQRCSPQFVPDFVPFFFLFRRPFSFSLDSIKYRKKRHTERLKTNLDRKEIPSLNLADVPSLERWRLPSTASMSADRSGVEKDVTITSSTRLHSISTCRFPPAAGRPSKRRHSTNCGPMAVNNNNNNNNSNSNSNSSRKRNETRRGTKEGGRTIDGGARAVRSIIQRTASSAAPKSHRPIH